MQDEQTAVALAEQMTSLVKTAHDAQHRACVTRAAASLLLHQQASSHPHCSTTLCSLANNIIKVLCRLYKADQVGEATTLLDVLQQQVGEGLAALPDSWRTQPTFVQLVQAAFSLLKAGLKHAPNNPDVLRGIRRTLAALPPSGQVETQSHVAEETATWLMRVVLHSRFLPIVARRSSAPIVLPWCAKIDLPITSVMPLVGSEDDVTSLPRTNDELDVLKAEWLTLVDTLLDMFMAYHHDGTCAKELQVQLEALVPVLLSSYSATMCASDRATWSSLMAIDQFVHSQSGCPGPDDHEYGVSCMVHGVVLRQG